MQQHRSITFSRAIRDAFVIAGECPDFREDISYEPPTTVFMDTLVDILAEEISDYKISKDSVLDTLNWFIYESDWGRGWILPTKEDRDSHLILGLDKLQSSAYYIVTKNGVEYKLYCRDAGELWDSIMYEYGLNTFGGPNIVTIDRSLPLKDSIE